MSINQWSYSTVEVHICILLGQTDRLTAPQIKIIIIIKASVKATTPFHTVILKVREKKKLSKKLRAKPISCTSSTHTSDVTVPFRSVLPSCLHIPHPLYTPQKYSSIHTHIHTTTGSPSYRPPERTFILPPFRSVPSRPSSS